MRCDPEPTDTPRTIHSFDKHLTGAVVAATLVQALFRVCRRMDGRDGKRSIADRRNQRRSRGRVTNQSSKEGQMQKNIVETARDAGSFTSLMTALDRARLDATLASEGPLTVFAPR